MTHWGLGVTIIGGVPSVPSSITGGSGVFGMSQGKESPETGMGG